jgi:hypothetical protein
VQFTRVLIGVGVITVSFSGAEAYQRKLDRADDGSDSRAAAAVLQTGDEDHAAEFRQRTANHLRSDDIQFLKKTRHM